jgi:carboxymethylenebutenolidase
MTKSPASPRQHQRPDSNHTSDPEIDRRQFLTSAVAGSAMCAGYALAIRPVTALAVTTSASNLNTGAFKVPVGHSTEMPLWAAWPKKGAGKSPVIVVIHEIFGVHEYIKDICRRLALEGWYAVAPDLFFRHGDATKIADIDTLRKNIVSKVSQKEVLSDLDATIKWAGTQEGADASRVGMTGFCWGGTTTWMYAAYNPAIKAGVAWYGRLIGDKTPLIPQFPVDIGASLKVPVLGLYGDKDSGIPLSTVEHMKKELAKGLSGSKFIVYEGAQHAFHADYRPSYDEKSAKAAWDELVKWFKNNHLKPS